MKTRELVLILGLGIFATEAGAQTTSTNFLFTTPAQGVMGAPSTPATNPFFASAFRSGTGVQIATTTNVPLGIPSQTPQGAPSIVETNPYFGSAFQSKTGVQTSAATNFSLGIPSQTATGIPSTTGTNPVFGTPFQSNVGVSTSITTNPVSGGGTQNGIVGARSTTTNFLFASSAQSWVGQGQGVFATPTNGYNVRLAQISPDILQFSISSTSSASTNWLLEFDCTNDFFTTGVYSNAMNAGGNPARLVFGGMGRGDVTSDGAFKVLEAGYSNNQIVSFAADFVQLDNNDTNDWNEGSIRYNSTIPDTVNLLMAPVAISFQKGNTVLTWSTNLTDFQLEYATNMPAGIWFTNNSIPAIIDGQYTVTNGVSAGTRLYRLMKRL